MKIQVKRLHEHVAWNFRPILGKVIVSRFETQGVPEATSHVLSLVIHQKESTDSLRLRDGDVDQRENGGSGGSSGKC